MDYFVKVLESMIYTCKNSALYFEYACIPCSKLIMEKKFKGLQKEMLPLLSALLSMKLNITEIGTVTFRK